MIRLGTLRRCRTEVAATASGGETIAPSTNAAGQPIAGMAAWATQATTVVVATTSPTARRTMGRRLAAKSRQEVSQAAANSSGGRNSSSTSPGSIRARGSPGAKARASPPITRRMG